MGQALEKSTVHAADGSGNSGHANGSNQRCTVSAADGSGNSGHANESNQRCTVSAADGSGNSGHANESNQRCTVNAADGSGNSGHANESNQEDMRANFIKLIFIVLIILMMVGESALIFSGQLIKKEKTCDIKEALKLLSINVQCKYSDVENCLEKKYDISISSMFFDGIFLISGMILMCKGTPDRICHLVFAILYLISIFSFQLGFGITFLNTQTQIVNAKTGQTSINYTQIKINMKESLDQYTSDVITNSDTISDKWNTFFIQYDCCAVTQVTSTTNDFDTTPWCTTSGTCQQTNSQIPKTCCKDVTEADYMNAEPSCHATVTLGTFKDSCFSKIRKLDVEIMTEYEVNLLSTALITTGSLKVVFALSILAVFIYFIILDICNALNCGDCGIELCTPEVKVVSVLRIHLIGNQMVNQTQDPQLNV